MTGIRQKKPKITEKLFQGRVEQALKIAGWRVYHTWNSMRSAKGFPDIVALHPKRKKPLVVELKTETGKLTPEQEEWLALFSDCGVDTWLLRPSMFDEFWEHVRQ